MAIVAEPEAMSGGGAAEAEAHDFRDGSVPALTQALKAAGEETRLRILTLLAGGERSVKDLTDILSQSQPRISRHLKLLLEAGLIERHREGTWAFFRLADGPGGRFARSLVERLQASDPLVARDRPGWRRCGPREPRRRGAISRRTPASGTVSVRCMPTIRRSRRRCWRARPRTSISWSIWEPAPGG